MYSYIFWLLIFVLIPTIILWVIYPFIIKKYYRTLILCSVGSLIFSIPWDIWAKKTNIWYWPRYKIIGVYLFGLPLEEYLFIIFATVFISTITLILRKKTNI